MKKILMGVVVAGLIGSSALLASEPTAAEIKKWAEVGVSKEWISNWKYDGYTPEKVKPWFEVDITSANEIEAWQSFKIAPKEAKAWMELGINSRNMYDLAQWKNAGVNTPEQAKKWHDLRVNASSVSSYIKDNITPEILRAWNDIGVRGNDISIYKEHNINTPEEAKMWHKAGLETVTDLQYIKRLDITTLEEFSSWTELGMGLYDIQQWKNAGFNDPKVAQEWKKVTLPNLVHSWHEAGIDNPKEAQRWQNAGVGVYGVQTMKKANLTPEQIKAWVDYGIKDQNQILDLTYAGFQTPKQYDPYKGYSVDHGIKLKQWNIKPNKLIKSMSRSNNIFGRELFFTDEQNFKTAYKVLNDQCDEIVKDKWFAAVDMSQNKNKCFIFVGKMIQRLDNKSLFGKVTQKGLVSGMGDQYFFAESFQGNWMERDTKIGVIKGSGSHSYETRVGTQVVPRGNVIFFK